jgi:hypothetical protein
MQMIGHHRVHFRRLARRGFPVAARLARLVEEHAPTPKPRPLLPEPQEIETEIRAAG